MQHENMITVADESCPGPVPEQLCVTIVQPSFTKSGDASDESNVSAGMQRQFLSLPSPSEAAAEAKSLLSLSFPIALTALLLYSRSAVSVFFLGTLGDLPLAAGSLAVAFANITGYSVLSGLSLGMEPLCSQAFGAGNPHLLSLTLRRTVLFLLTSALPVSFLWLHSATVLIPLGQDPEISQLAQTYLRFSLPDLVTLSLLHPFRVFLRCQGLTRPFAIAAAFSAAVHVATAFLLGTHFKLGLPGVAAAGAFSNIVLLVLLISYIWRRAGETGLTLLPEAGKAGDCLRGWAPLAQLAIPSCVSVCLEWWWYELIILLCGLLPDPKPAVAAMGVLIQTTALLYIFPSSLGLAVSARVGNELGANRPARARAAACVAIAASAVSGLAAAGFAAGISGQWGRIFTADDAILQLTAAALPILGLCELGNCPQTVGCGVLRGCARPRVSAGVNLGAFYLVGMPVAVGLAFFLGVGFCGLWVGLLAAQVCCAGLMMYVVGTTDWDAQARRAQSLTCPTGDLKCGKRCGDADGDVTAQEIEIQPLIMVKVENGFEKVAA